MYLQYGMTVVSISGENIQLPQDIITSLSKRGKRSKNFKFDNTDNSIDIYCVKCKKYHKVYKYNTEKLSWIDTGEFKRSREKGGEKRLYLGSECKVHSINNDNDKKGETVKINSQKVKTTLFLEEALFKYLGIVGACTNRSRTEIINEIIRKEQERKPIADYLKLNI